MIRLICIQTYHGHWAGPSGYHRYLPHLKGAFRLDHRRIERGKVSRSELQGLERWLFPTLLRVARRFLDPWATERDVLEEYRAFRQVRRYLKAGEQVIVHFMDGEVGFSFFGTYLAVLGRARDRLRVMATYHQPPMYLEKVLRHPKRTDKLDLILTVGTSQFPFFDSVAHGRLRFVPHGVDTDYFRPADRRGIGDKLFCITVGQWLRDFDALEKVIRLAPPAMIFRLVAIRDSLERFRELPNVELYSGIDDDALRQLYQESDIGLMPLQDGTANNALLEMMASGLPIIVTRVGSIGDYVSDSCCRLLSSNGPEEILRSLEELERNTEEMRRLGDAAREQALEYSWPKVAEQMAETYRLAFQ